MNEETMRVGKPIPTRMVNQSYTHGPWSDILLIVDKYGAYHGMPFVCDSLLNHVGLQLD